MEAGVPQDGDEPLLLLCTGHCRLLRRCQVLQYGQYHLQPERNLFNKLLQAPFQCDRWTA